MKSLRCAFYLAELMFGKKVPGFSVGRIIFYFSSSPLIARVNGDKSSISWQSSSSGMTVLSLFLLNLLRRLFDYSGDLTYSSISELNLDTAILTGDFSFYSYAFSRLIYSLFLMGDGDEATSLSLTFVFYSF